MATALSSSKSQTENDGPATHQDAGRRPLRVPTGITASFGCLSLDGGDHGNEAVIPLGALSLARDFDRDQRTPPDRAASCARSPSLSTSATRRANRLPASPGGPRRAFWVMRPTRFHHLVQRLIHSKWALRAPILKGSRHEAARSLNRRGAARWRERKRRPPQP